MAQQAMPSPIQTQREESYIRKQSPLSLETTKLLITPYQSSEDNLNLTNAENINFQTSRWKNIEHELDTIDDYTLLEEIRDLKASIPTSKNKIFDAFEIFVFKHYKIENIHQFNNLQQRIRALIIRMNEQNGFDLRSTNNVKKCKDLYFLHVDASFIAKRPSMSRTVSMEHIQSYNDIKNEFCKYMLPFIGSSQILMEQYLDSSCHDLIEQKKDILQCPCIERICVLMKMYYKFQKLIVKLPNEQQIELISEYISIDDYGYKEVLNDFVHIHEKHMKNNDKMQKFVCFEMKKKYKCNLKPCNAELRHSLTRSAKINIDCQPIDQFEVADEDIIYAQKCDSIHAYFFHSSVQFGTKYVQRKYKKDKNEELKSESPRSDESELADQYIGTEEDKEWMQQINEINICKEQQIYDKLMKNMPTFQWQSAQLKVYILTHIKAKFANIKEEVLHNSFCCISVDNWNQTLRKSKVFSQLWASKSIRTLQSGQFQDYVMAHCAEWQSGEVINLQSILVLKLYTDYDELQNELKKCFRMAGSNELDSLSSPNKKKINILRQILQSSQQDLITSPSKMKTKHSISSMSTTMTPSHAYTSSLSMELKRELVIKEAIELLEDRLSEFFYWRASLLIFINKFAKKFEPTKYGLHSHQSNIYYHGVNDKMILSPITTQSFFGPLSTSSSYHVAKSFATDSGMVIALSSQYPRLKTCNVFDASMLSDYPEEQEHLIGFMYMRVMKIYTDSDMVDYGLQLPVDSDLKFVFFVIHLFEKQIFSLNDELEKYLAGYLKIYLFVYPNEQNIKKYHFIDENEKEENEIFGRMNNIIKWAQDEKKRFNANKLPTTDYKFQSAENELYVRRYRVYYILLKQFVQFCEEPNLKQIVKIDCISDGIKRYFMDFDEEKNEYVVSFDKLKNIYPKLKEIHFLNWYFLDNAALKKLIRRIEENEENTLRLIKFLYYDYNDSLNEQKYFKHPKHLDQKLIKKLEKMGWKIKYKDKTNEKTGYWIKIIKL